MQKHIAALACITMASLQAVTKTRKEEQRYAGNPILEACYRGDIEGLKKLNPSEKEMNKAERDALSRDDDGFVTPLCVAIRTENMPLIEYLVEHRANANGDMAHTIPLVEAIFRVENKELLVRIVRYLIVQGGANVNGAGWRGTTALHAAARKNLINIAKILVEERKANLNPKDANGATPLYVAEQQGHIAVMSFLKSKGAQSEGPKAPRRK